MYFITDMVQYDIKFYYYITRLYFNDQVYL